MRHTWHGLHPFIPATAAFVLTVLPLLAGCAANRATTQKGDSGPIAWKVTDIRQSLEERGNRMRWDYTLTLYEADGRRRLAIDYDGVDWKGELTPAE